MGIQPYVEDFIYVERVSFTDKQTASCKLISRMALEFYDHNNGKIDISGYVDGTAFCKADGISGLEFVNDYEPIVRIPNNRTATINVSGSLKGEISASLEAEFSASEGFEIVEVGGSIGGSVNGTIYVSKDITLSHKYIEYSV